MIRFREYAPLVFVVLLVLLSFILIKPFLLALSLGALLAYVFTPVYRFILRGVKHESLAAFLVCFLFVLIIAIPGFFFVQALIKESYVLFVLVKQKLATGIFTNCEQFFCPFRDLGENAFISTQIKDVAHFVTNWIIQKGSALLLSLPRLLLNLFVVFFTMFYFLKDGGKFVQRIGELLSMKQRRYIFIVGRLREIVRAVVYGSFLVALIQGALGALGFFLFGVPSPLFWGLVMALLALIPYVGTGIVWGPAALILITDGLLQGSQGLLLRGIGLFVYGFIFVSSLDNIIKPKILGHRAGVHPAIILLGTVGGIFFLGPLGVLFGPLVLSLTTVVIEAYFLHEFD